MTRENERTVRQSVLDRLSDDNPGLGDPTITFAESVRRTKAALLRDLDWLMNTRRIPEEMEDAQPELNSSVYYYGLDDRKARYSENPTEQKKLQREVLECLRLFEPRLTQIEVSVVPPDADSKWQVRFVVEALLMLDPDPERVVFDTVLDVSSGEFSMTGHG